MQVEGVGSSSVAQSLGNGSGEPTELMTLLNRLL